MSNRNIPIDITALNINVENPRFEMAGNQREAITTMIKDQGEKLLKLATDIVEEGLNPGDLIFVAKHKKIEDQYNVLEGNRRVTAIKLLENPDLIPESHKGLLNKFRKLSEQYAHNPYEEISCVVFDNEQEAEHWIELKHTGQNEGVGTVGWDAQQKSRFDERVKGTASLALQVIDFLQKENNFDEELKPQLKEVKSSSLQRLVGDPDYRKVVGIEIRNGKLTTKFDPAEVVKPLTKTVRDLLSEDFTVKDIYYKDDRLTYLETFRKSELPDKTKELAGNWELISTTPPKKVDLNASNTGKKRKSNQVISKRKTIIPKSTIIPINQPRVNKIYHELKDLDLSYFENSAAITFRVFIELTLDSYIEKSSISGLDEHSKLSHKLKSVATDLQNKNLMTKNQLKGAYTTATMKDSIFSIDTFNAYVHNKDFHPDSESLKKNWDNLELFFIKIWDLV